VHTDWLSKKEGTLRSRLMLYRGWVRMLVVRMGPKLILQFVAVHLKELNLVLQKNPITVEVDQEHLINFQRYVKFMDQAKELFHYKTPDLEMYRHDGRLEYLEDQLRSLEVSKKTEDEVGARSLFLERRENVDQKGRKAMLQTLGFDLK
jgi:hypothetical protein